MDACQEGHPVPDEAVVREQLLRMNVNGPAPFYREGFPPLSCSHE